MTFRADCPKCGGKKKIKVETRNGEIRFSPCFKCGAPGSRVPLDTPPIREKWKPKKNRGWNAFRSRIRRRNPDIPVRTAKLYGNMIAFLRPGSNASEGEKFQARARAKEYLLEFPDLWREIGPIPGETPPDLAPKYQSPSGRKWTAPKPEDWKEEKEEKAKRAKRPPVPKKAKFARRRPPGWTEEDERRKADAERKASAAKKGGFQGKSWSDLRAPASTLAEAKDGILIWCADNENVAMLYVLGNARSRHRTCIQAHAAADLWFAEKPKRLARYPRYEAMGEGGLRRVA